MKARKNKEGLRMKKVRNIMMLSLFLCSLVILAIPMTSRAAKAKLSKTKDLFSSE